MAFADTKLAAQITINDSRKTIDQIGFASGIGRVHTTTRHNLTPGDVFVLTGATHHGADGKCAVLEVLDAQTLTFPVPLTLTPVPYGTADAGTIDGQRLIVFPNGRSYQQQHGGTPETVWLTNEQFLKIDKSEYAADGLLSDSTP